MSTIIDTLVHDRTQADVKRVFTLKNKILTRGLNALTAEEKTEYMAGMKGAYNYTDKNRVGHAVAYIAGRMTSIPTELATYREGNGVADAPIYHVPYNPSSVLVSAKTDWVMGDIPTQAQEAAYLNNLTILRGQLTLPPTTPPVPSSMDRLTYAAANEIEYLLCLINTELTCVETALYNKVDMTVPAFSYADTCCCGD